MIINTGKTPEEIKERYSLGNRKVYTVDATRIAMEELKRPLMNVPMLGALVKALKGPVTLESVEKNVREAFGKKVSEEVLNANIRALRRAYEEVRG